MPAQPRRRPRFVTTIDPHVLARLRAHSEETGEAIARLIDRAVKALLAAEAAPVEAERVRRVA